MAQILVVLDDTRMTCMAQILAAQNDTRVAQILAAHNNDTRMAQILVVPMCCEQITPSLRKNHQRRHNLLITNHQLCAHQAGLGTLPAPSNPHGSRNLIHHILCHHHQGPQIHPHHTEHTTKCHLHCGVPCRRFLR